MPHTYAQITAAILAIGLTAACGGSNETPPARTPPPDAKRVDASKAGSVAGRVMLDGPLPENAPIKIDADPACAREHKGGVRLDTFVGENGGLGNVFVYVKDGLGGYFFDTPAEPVVLDQKGCLYTPHVLGVQVGQTIAFVNSDPTMHNVQAQASSNAEFNFGQPIQGQKDTKFFSQPEVMVHMKCNVHNWMSAYIGVLEHPYFAVSTPGGEFSIQNLPAGTYTVEAWHEKLGTQTQQVTLADHEKQSITFTFKAG
jgi:plastocyanin